MKLLIWWVLQDRWLVLFFLLDVHQYRIFFPFYISFLKNILSCILKNSITYCSFAPTVSFVNGSPRHAKLCGRILNHRQREESYNRRGRSLNRLWTLRTEVVLIPQPCGMPDETLMTSEKLFSISTTVSDLVDS